MKYGKLDELDETHKWKLGLVKAILYHIMSVAGLIMDSAFDARCYVWKNLKYLCTIINVHFGEWITLESGIDVGQGINVGPGKFAKKNKRRANLCYKKPIKLENICRSWEKFQNLINVGPLIRL